MSSSLIGGSMRQPTIVPSGLKFNNLVFPYKPEIEVKSSGQRFLKPLGRMALYIVDNEWQCTLFKTKEETRLNTTTVLVDYNHSKVLIELTDLPFEISCLWDIKVEINPATNEIKYGLARMSNAKLIFSLMNKLRGFPYQLEL